MIKEENIVHFWIYYLLVKITIFEGEIVILVVGLFEIFVKIEINYVIFKSTKL